MPVVAPQRQILHETMSRATKQNGYDSKGVNHLMRLVNEQVAGKMAGLEDARCPRGSFW